MKQESIKIEALESRTFLSATLESTVAPGPAIVQPIIPVVTGPTIHATAGTPFSGEVGFYASPVLDPPLVDSATINWGDGVTTKATLHYGQNGNQFGIIISGVHTYAKAGTYAAVVTLVQGPINPKMGLPTRILEIFRDKAIVTPFPANSPGGVTIIEPVGKKFTATVGKFTFIAPGGNFTATISWGDGTTSTGVVVAGGVEGIDVIKYVVNGTHTYSLAGKYAIKIVVYRNLSAGATPVVFTTIDSTADVVSPVAVG